MKATIRIATGPQYEYMEVEGTEADIPQLLAYQAQYGATPLKVKDTRVKLDAFVGGSIYFDEAKHEYTNEAGAVYLSGSAYAKQFEEPFDQARISEAMAKKFKAPVADIVKMWEMKAEISRGLGTALHAAMELYGRYNGLAKQMERSALHDNPMVMEAVKQFYAAHPEDAIFEALVVDHQTKRAGRIDRLEETKDGYVIADFKTNVNIQKSLPTYQKQLSFYAAILRANGVIPKGIRVYHWDGSAWTTYELNEEQV